MRRSLIGSLDTRSAGRSPICEALDALAKAAGIVQQIEFEAHEERDKSIDSAVKEVTDRLSAFVIALLSDEPVPVSFFERWASYEMFWKWRKTGRITLSKANGKVCVKPRDFFEFWRSECATSCER